MSIDIEVDSFRSSILYWVGILEGEANLQFVQELNGGKSDVATWRVVSILSEADGITAPGTGSPCFFPVLYRAAVITREAVDQSKSAAPSTSATARSTRVASVTIQSDMAGQLSSA